MEINYYLFTNLTFCWTVSVLLLSNIITVLTARNRTQANISNGTTFHSQLEFGAIPISGPFKEILIYMYKRFLYI